MANLLNLFQLKILTIKFQSILFVAIVVLLLNTCILMMVKSVLKLLVKFVGNILNSILNIAVKLNIIVLTAGDLYSFGKNKSSVLSINVIMINVISILLISINLILLNASSEKFSFLNLNYVTNLENIIFPMRN